MGSQASAEVEDSVPHLSVLPGQSAPSSSSVVGRPTNTKARAREHVPAAPADGPERFAVPEGWRVVCRLSQSDARARWGSRPRRAAARVAAAAAASSEEHLQQFEADVVLPEMAQPLRVPLQLLPQWVDPQIGMEFVGRYEVLRFVPTEPGLRGRMFQVHDKVQRRNCGLRVCALSRESDVRAFGARMQLEQLDSDSRLFLKIQDVFISPPAKLVVIEDAPVRSLWQELGRLEQTKAMVSTVVQVANSVLTGLGRLHAHSWAHGGVSPLTVCITDHGLWRLSNLDSARKVSSLAANPFGRSGTAMPPEALLGLVISEKVDVWQLAVSLCEAIMRRRLEPVGRRKATVAESICLLIDFLGPLPSKLVEEHPDREVLFTPDGHVLRPATPNLGRDSPVEVEALEPLPNPAVEARKDARVPCPILVQEKLRGIEGGAGAIEFLGRLLNPDPEQRPSASEATAHHFLRFAQSKGLIPGERARGSQDVRFVDGLNCTASPSVKRKPTGFVSAADLQLSDEEEEDDAHDSSHAAEKEAAAAAELRRERKLSGTLSVGIDVSAAGGHRIARKATGFVKPSELPVEDEDEDDEEADEEEPRGDSRAEAEASAQAEDARPRARCSGEAAAASSEPSPQRSSPLKARLSVEAEAQSASDSPRGVSGSRARFGVGGEASSAADSPRRGALSKPSFGVDAEPGSPESHSPRKEPRPKARFSDLVEEQEVDTSATPKSRAPDGAPAAAQTHQPHAAEAPQALAETVRPAAKQVRVAANSGQAQGSGRLIQRHGTGFIRDLPLDLEDEEDAEGEEEPATPSVSFRPEAPGDGEAPAKIARNATGFVKLSDLELLGQDDEEDEDEDGEEAFC